MIYSYFKQKSVILTIDQPTGQGQFTIQKSIIQKIQKHLYINSPSIKIPISESSQVYLYKLSSDNKKKMITKNQDFLQEIQRYLNNLVSKCPNQKLFEKTEHIVKIYEQTKRILMPNVINNSFRKNTEYDKLVQKILTYFQNIAYSINKQIQINTFCNEVLGQEKKSDIQKQIQSIWIITQKITQESVKKIIIKIEEQYKKIVNSFIIDLNEEIQNVKKNKKQTLLIIKKLQKFSQAKMTQVIPELEVLQTAKQSTKNLMKIHHDVKNINKILNLVTHINIVEASQTVKNHLNEKLNQIRKHQENIFISENCVKTTSGQNTDLISSQNYRYNFINQYSGNYFSMSDCLRMSYPKFGDYNQSKILILRAGHNNAYFISNYNVFLSVKDLEKQREKQRKQQQQKQYQQKMKLIQLLAMNNNPIPPTMFYPSPYKNQEKKQPRWSVCFTKERDSNSIWQFKLLKNGCYNIINKNSGCFLQSGGSTAPDRSVFLGLAYEGESINWIIQEAKEFKY